MNAEAIELGSVKPVTTEMLDGARLTKLEEEPAYVWAFRGENFWLERHEAAPLPAQLVTKIFGNEAEIPWIRGKWEVSEDGATLTLRSISGADGGTAAEATLPLGLAALMQITVADEQYAVEKSEAAKTPMFKSGQPVAFKDRSASPALWGFRSPVTGSILIPAIYTKASDFSHQGVACVMDGDEPYVVNESGERLVRPLWADGKLDPFKEGLARYISDTGKMGYFNSSGEVAIPGQWTHVQPFSNGLALVNNGGEMDPDGTVTGGLWGAINDLGQVILKIDFEQLERGPGSTFRTSPAEPWFRPGSMSGE